MYMFWQQSININHTKVWLTFCLNLTVIRDTQLTSKFMTEKLRY